MPYHECMRIHLQTGHEEIGDHSKGEGGKEREKEVDRNCQGKYSTDVCWTDGCMFCEQKEKDGCKRVTDIGNFSHIQLKGDQDLSHSLSFSLFQCVWVCF